ncbi:hypothetical protein J4E08_16260 [Sagittula sp. NFXS13]|uniref:hypothetical protein n=1 Tax=Sagittula sp. NFXS13 TaxID=2819095 RepID=UPI0032E00FC3
MTLETGSWELWAGGDLSLVLDVDPHVAFAYLVREGGGMLCSVWVCNLPGPLPDEDDEEALPVVANAFVLPGATAPASLDALEMIVTPTRWVLSWPGGRSVLSATSTLGWSSAVGADSPFAKPLEELPI